MEKKYLIVNTGSASKKYALYEGEKQLAFLHLEGEDGGFLLHGHAGEKELRDKINLNQFENSLEVVLKIMTENNLLTKNDDIAGIGIRVVAPGLYFEDHRLIDEEYLSQLVYAREKAPLHMTMIAGAVDSLKRKFPSQPIVGISDSAFHKTMNKSAKIYGLPKGLTEKFEIYRYGYHGLSMTGVLGKIKEKFGEVPEKVIVCHLGGGVSLTALKNGESVDTTMGFTPLEGMLMATRVGDIDAGAVLYLAEKTKMTITELRQYFNSQCGLLGVSERSSDVRDLIKLEDGGDEQSKIALDLFAYKVKKAIGSYIATLNGVDLIVFTGTIGERSFIMRRRILSDLDHLGIKLDEEKNNSVISQDEVISKEKAKVKIAVLKTDEMKELARLTISVLSRT